jgi:Spy/CpxP family protein refolding chaperone
MKSSTLFSQTRILVLTLLLGLTPLLASSQPRRSQPMNDGPRHHMRADRPDPAARFERMAAMLELTDQQKEQIKTIQVNGWEDTKPLRNQLDVKRAELRALMSSDSPSQKQINAKIEEMGKLRVELQQKRTSHRLAVRALLTNEQQMKFDQMGQRRAARRGFK